MDSAMHHIEQLLSEGFIAISKEIKCNNEALSFYQETFEECVERLKDVAWDSDQGWDFEHLSIIYDTLSIEFECLPEDIGNTAFHVAESHMLNDDYEKRLTALHQYHEDEDNPIDLAAPLLMAIKYIERGLGESTVKPWHYYRIGQLVMANTLWLVTVDTAERLPDQLEPLHDAKQELRSRTSKGGKTKRDNFDKRNHELRLRTHELAKNKLVENRKTSISKLVDYVLDEVTTKESPVYETSITRWVKEARSQFLSNDQETTATGICRSQ